MMFANLLSPMIMVFFLSVILTFVVTLIYKVFTDQEKSKELMEKTKELNEKIKKARKENKQDELMKYNQELMKVSTENMKLQYKPMLISFIVIIPIFTWIGPKFFGSQPIVNLPFSILGHTSLTWVGWYIIVSIPMGIIFRKILGMN